MKAVFKEIIKPFFNLICRPLDSMPNVYKAKRPLILYDLIKKLDTCDYKINKLVLNFNNKVIGLIAKEPPPYERTGFVPPVGLMEAISKTVNYEFIEDHKNEQLFYTE